MDHTLFRRSLLVFFFLFFFFLFVVFLQVEDAEAAEGAIQRQPIFLQEASQQLATGLCSIVAVLFTAKPRCRRQLGFLYTHESK